MIRLNRTSEYGLMALKQMGRKRRIEPTEVTSAREIADSYGLPFEITAKTLQRLKDAGLIQSAQGARGGYTLRRDLREITLAEFLELMEGPQALMACANGHSTGAAPSPLDAPLKEEAWKEETGKGGCEYEGLCEIRHFLGRLNNKIHAFLSGIVLSELMGDSAGAPETEERLLDETAHLSG